MKYDYGLWALVALDVVWLTGFALASLRPGWCREWRSPGIFTGFVVALDVERYGFPLTIYYVLTALLGWFDWFLHCHKPMHMEGGMIVLARIAG